MTKEVREPRTTDRLLWFLRCAETEVEVMSIDEGVFDDLELADIEQLFLAEERMRRMLASLSRLLQGEQMGETYAGLINSPDHPVLVAAVARAKERRDAAARVRRRHLRVVR